MLSSFSRPLLLLRSIRASSSLPLQSLPSLFLSTTPLAHKGHSKWDNIRHIKGANDAKRAKQITLYKNKAVCAIKENGNQTDPKLNRALAKVLEEARAQMVPMQTLENTIKSKTNTAQVEFAWAVRGPGSCSVIVEGLANNVQSFTGNVKNVLKRFASIQESHRMNDFVRRGIFLVAKKPDTLATIDQAEEMAIECDCEEVEEEDDCFVFYCNPRDTAHSRRKLDASGCEVVSAAVQYLPEVEVAVSEKAFGAMTTFREKLLELDVVVEVYDNIERPPKEEEE